MDENPYRAPKRGSHATPNVTAYVGTRYVGETLPDMPIFLTPDFYVPAPLEATYQAAWEHFPRGLRGLLENGR